MTELRPKDTLLLMTGASGLVALALLVVAIATGRGWWVTVFMAAATAWFGILYVRELHRFRGNSAGSARP